MESVEDIEFSSLQELYERLKPALVSKERDLHRAGYSYIKYEDIWNYLKDTKWMKSSNLLLYQMVDDVINANPLALDDYIKNKLKDVKRTINLEEE